MARVQRRPRSSSTPQPPAKRRGTTSEDADDYFMREMTRLDEKHAEREERHAERVERRVGALDEDIYLDSKSQQ